MNGDHRALPHLHIPIVDVRDVADAHVRAMTATVAAGERYLLSNGPAMDLAEIAAIVRAHAGPRAPHVPSRSIPDLVVRAGALLSPRLREIAPEVGYAKRTSNRKAVGELGWQPRAAEEAIAAAADSLIERGLIRR